MFKLLQNGVTNLYVGVCVLVEQTNYTFYWFLVSLCVMEMELDLVLNWIDSKKKFVKIFRIKKIYKSKKLMSKLGQKSHAKQEKPKKEEKG